MPCAKEWVSLQDFGISREFIERSFVLHLPSDVQVCHLLCLCDWCRDFT